MKEIKKIRRNLEFFMVCLLLSGLTALPIESELNWIVHNDAVFPIFLQDWFSKIYQAIKYSNLHYPQLAYGTDWLSFAHIVIAVVFIGPWKNPVKNSWVIQFGLIACAMIIPFALIAGYIREIPWYWRIIDCAFGIIGAIPLWNCYKSTKKIENKHNLNQTS